MKSRALRSIAFTILLSFIAFLFAYEAVTFLRVVPSEPRTSVVIFIKPNSTVRTIAQQLKENHILTSPWKFRILARVQRVERILKPGEYRFDAPSAPEEAIRILVEGKVVLHKITFPEGTTIEEMGDTYASQQLMSLETFQKIISEKDLLARWRIPGSSFEGFLFPDTYYFSKLDDPGKMLRTMVDRFKQAIAPADLQRAQELNFNLLQWVTLASIIEKESSVPEEQPLVSSVFHNRLKKKMRLQSDPTVIYGIKNFNGNITKKDLLTPTEYNTYTRAGLPPGPIANPGLTSLKAAIYPAQTDYLYFVSKKDGTHAFSKTYEEHAKNVAYYQLKIKSERKDRTR